MNEKDKNLHFLQDKLSHTLGKNPISYLFNIPWRILVLLILIIIIPFRFIRDFYKLMFCDCTDIFVELRKIKEESGKNEV